MSTLHSFPRFLQCVDRFLQCVAYLQLRLLHVVDQTGVDTAAVSGNLYLQLVVENDVPCRESRSFGLELPSACFS